MGAVLAAIGKAALSAGASYLGSVIQNRQNEKLMDKQNALNVEQWNRENAYNRPAAQMARFKEAGLNPDLIYGQSNSSGSVTPSPDLLAAANPFGTMSSIMNAGLNAEKLQAEVNVLDAQAYELRHRGDLHQSQASQLDALVERYGHLNGLTDEQTKQVTEEIKKTQQEVTNLVTENANQLIKGQILTHEERIAAVKEQFAEDKERAEIDKLVASAELDRAQAKRVRTLIQYEVEKLIAETNYVQQLKTTEEKKAQLLQGQYEAMIPNILNGLALSDSLSGATDDKGVHRLNGSKAPWLAKYAIGEVLAMVGKVLHVNLSSFSGMSDLTSHRVGTVDNYEGDINVGGRVYGYE